MVGVSASVSLPLHYKVQKFSSGTGTPRWCRKKGCKMVVCLVTFWPGLCLFVMLVNVRVCVHDFAMKVLEYRNEFDAVG